MADAPTRGGVAGSYVTTVTYGSPSFAQTQGYGSGWFGPSSPLVPVAPPDVATRQFDYPSGYNLNTRPRTYEGISFGMLRGLADGYDLLRAIIETRKDQIARMSWTIKGRDATANDGSDPRVAALTKFFQRPDGVHGWTDWLRPVLEDLFVIDAPALYMQRDRGGQLLQLLQIDGATIKPVIDNWGRTPQPYVDGRTMVYPAAYQQVLKGFPAVDYSTRDLLYRPRNRRVQTPYGMSPVEQIVTTVNIALRRQLFTLSYFTEGSIPDSFVSVPDTWTPDQILTYQRAWDALLTGDLAARRKVKFVPGGVGKAVHETKTPDLKGDFDEWLAKLICFAFSISPQALTRQMNRASADTQKEISEEEGLQPILLWIKALIDDIIVTEFEAEDLEFVWDTDDEVDRSAQQTILTGYTGKGIMTINEARDELGLDPLPDPEASQAMIVTATGLVPLGSYAQTQQQQADQMQANAEAKARFEASPPAAGDQQESQGGRPPRQNEAEDVAKFNAHHDAQGRFASSDDAAVKASDWKKAKEAALSVAKGVALLSVAAIGAALAPEVLGVAGGAAAGAAAIEAGATAAEAVSATTAQGSAAWVTHTVNGVATGMFWNAGIKSATVLLQHAGFNTAAIEAKIKPVTDFFKAGGGGIDAQLRDVLCEVANHARDELIAHVESQYAGRDHLATATEAISASCDSFKAAIGKLYKGAVGKRRVGMAWRRPEPIPFDRPATAKAEAAISKRIAAAFTTLAPKFAAVLRSANKMAKAASDEPDDMDRALRRAEELTDGFDLGDLQDQASGIGDDLEPVVQDAVARTMAQIGTNNRAGLVNQVNARAVAFARDRAAELVGMRYDEDGELVPSANPDMAITDGTRAMLRETIADGLANGDDLDTIADTIETDYAFSEDRARLIAATEVSRANSEAALESYRAVSDSGVAVRKEWLAEAGCCDVCSDNAAAGAIELDDEFPSGDDTPPGHPNCRCSLTPVVGEDPAEKAYDPGQQRGANGRWSSSRLPALRTSAPNTALIGDALGRSLQSGAGYMPSKVHSKLKDKRPADYGYVIANLGAGLRRPDYAGVDPSHPKRIQLAIATPGAEREALLISITDGRNAMGKYAVITAFPVQRSKIDAKVKAGVLTATKKGP